MPTSSQSRILSVVDQQLLQQQQQSNGGDETNRISFVDAKRRSSTDEKKSPSRRRGSLKFNDGKFVQGSSTSRTSQRNDVLHLPVININDKAAMSTKSPEEFRRHSLNLNIQTDVDFRLKLNPTPMNNESSLSDFNDNDNEETENPNTERRASLLNDNARRLLVLGTIRPSKTFYKDLPTADVEHLMEYFQRMRHTNRRISSEEINQELKAKSIEYKPKMFYDSTSVTKSQVNYLEKLVEPYAEQIRNQQIELIKLENPIRFAIKSKTNETPLTTFPREYNDCMLTLISRTDPLRKSNLITELTSNKLIDDVKTNSLDISYFPGGVNYDVPRDEIDDKGQMKIETYEKLKQRLTRQKIRFFSDRPEKKPYALIAILPVNCLQIITHECLLDTLADHLKSLLIDEDNFNIEEKIISIEFVPLTCILDSSQISNEFIIDCDCQQTKQEFVEQTLKIQLKKQIISIDLHSYDEYMRKEYEKYLKSEKYQELIKNHERAAKRN